MRRCVVIALFAMSLVGCRMDTFSDYQPLSDSRFNGVFTYFYFWEDDIGLEEDTRYYSYTFDGTCDGTHYYNYKSFYIDSGWSEGKSYDYIKIEINESKTHFRTCLAAYTGWGNYEPFGSWSDWKKYEFLDGGNTLRIWDFPDKYPESYKDYIKD